MRDLAPPIVRVLCVDDNELVSEAIAIKLSLEPGLCYLGRLADANLLAPLVMAHAPEVVLLDIDMPGKDPFEAIEEIGRSHSPPRVIIFSGHVSSDLVDRAVEAGAWGYVSKAGGTDAILVAIRRVMEGEFTMSPDVEAEYGRGE